ESLDDMELIHDNDAESLDDMELIHDNDAESLDDMEPRKTISEKLESLCEDNPNLAEWLENWLEKVLDIKQQKRG
ncbi:MAG: hypothetical protein QXO24_02475, partial [Candidatus Micrarchaeaceae archaeon]